MSNNKHNIKEFLMQPMTMASFFMVAVIIIFPEHCFSQHKKKLTFNVDMNTQKTDLNVQLRGDFAPLSWYEGLKLSDPDKDGIYTVSVDFEIPEGIEFLNYKYSLNGDDWEAGQNRKISIHDDSNIFKDKFRYAKKLENPFKKFIGKWKLKDNNWEYTNEDLSVRYIKRPNHFIICKEVNTVNSVLLVVDTGASHGSAYWIYDADKKEMNSLSSFSNNRTGVGTGTIDNKGNIESKVRFQGVNDGRYRIYVYTWISENEYIIKSYEYDKYDKRTGSYYSGTFIRID